MAQGGSKASAWSVAVALVAVMLMLWAAIFLRVWGAKPPAPSDSRPVASAPAAPSATVPAAAPTLEPKTDEGRSASRIATMLSDARVAAEKIRVSGLTATPEQKEQAASVEREAEDLARKLAESLRKNPQAWPDVLDVGARLEDLKVAVRLGSIMAEAMDDTGEGVCSTQVLRHALARGRQVAATALAGGKTLESIVALIDATDRDGDGNVRYSAVTSLAQRRVGASPDLQHSIESALRRRAQSDTDEYIRGIAKNLVEPGPAPAGSRPPVKKRTFAGASPQK